MVGGEKRLVVVAACVLLDGEGRLLITKRPAGKPLAGLWEFPGGKVEADEALEAALVRELREELAVDIAESDLKPLTFTSHAYAEFHLLMPVYLCRCWQGEVMPLEAQEIRWVKPDELVSYDMPPADEPLKTTLRELLDK